MVRIAIASYFSSAILTDEVFNISLELPHFLAIKPDNLYYRVSLFKQTVLLTAESKIFCGRDPAKLRDDLYDVNPVIRRDRLRAL